MPLFKSWHHSLLLWYWTSYLTSLFPPSFLINFSYIKIDIQLSEKQNINGTFWE